jgi:hypothetical protein
MPADYSAIKRVTSLCFASFVAPTYRYRCTTLKPDRRAFAGAIDPMNGCTMYRMGKRKIPKRKFFFSFFHFCQHTWPSRRRKSMYSGDYLVPTKFQPSAEKSILFTQNKSNPQMHASVSSLAIPLSNKAFCIAI